MKRIAAFALAAMCGLSSVAADAIWTGTAGTSPLTAGDWTLPANWNGGVVPSDDSIVYFTNAYTTTRYILMPDETSVRSIYASCGSSASYNTTLIGKTLFLASDANGTLNFKGGNGLVQRVFADVSASHDLSMIHSSVAGDVSLASGKNLTFAGGYCRFYFDAYANTSDELRPNPISLGKIISGSATASMIGPAALASATTGVWKVTSGSPFIERVSGPVGTAIPAGCPLSGDGIPTGAFVKRIFANQYIEMSAPGNDSVAASTVRFERFIPQLTATLGSLQLNSSSTLYLSRRSNLAPFSLVMDDFRTYVQGAAFGLSLRSSSDLYPAEFVVKKGTDFWGFFNADSSRVRFAANPSGAAGLPNARYCTFVGGTVDLSVDADVSARLSVVTNVAGKVVKKGTGSLAAKLLCESSGSIVVEEGTFSFVENPDTPQIDTLAVSNGATVRVEGGVLRVANLVVEAGAVLEGPGEIEVIGKTPDLSGAVVSGGMTLALPGTKGSPVLSVPEGEVVGNPAFWVDASDTSTMELDGDGVLKWKDKRGDGYMFATNIVRRPTLVTDGAYGNYVKFPAAGGEIRWVTNDYTLVWSEIVPHIRAVFAMVDPSDNGGFFIGRSARITIPSTPSPDMPYGGYFYRANDSWYEPIIAYSKFFTGMRMYIDGDEVRPDSTYRGPIAQLVEMHFTDDGVQIRADAFGTTFMNGSSSYWAEGRLRLHEFILYTNELTQIERTKTAQYLMKKWKGRDVPVAETDSRSRMSAFSPAGATLSVAEGETIALDGIEGGELVKSGGGSLYVNVTSGGSIAAEGGETVIRSAPLTAESMPKDDCWIHLDAACPESLETNVVDNVARVSKWYDRNGNGSYACKTIRTTKAADTSLRGNVLNGLPMVDMGPLVYTDGVWAKPDPNLQLEIRKPNGSAYRSASHNFAATAPASKSIFIVYDSSGGGNSLLAARGADYHRYGFEANFADGVPTAMMLANNSTGLVPMKNCINFTGTNPDKASLLVRQNGEYFNPFTAGYSGGQDVFVYSTDAFGRRTSGFGVTGYDSYVGGFMIGEAIMYTNYIGEANTRYVEAYLMKKWKGVDTPGYGESTLDSLSLGAGASVKVYGTGALAVSNLVAKGGTLSGPVRLTEGAVIDIDVLSDGSLASVALGSGFDFDNGAALRIVGNVRGLRAGEYTVLTSPAITAGDAGKFSLASTEVQRRHIVSLSVSDGAVKVSFSRRGLQLVVE